MTSQAATAATITPKQRKQLAGMTTYCAACHALASIVWDEAEGHLRAVCDACGTDERATL